ncbi:Predicted arabinose efflux permease, MFS family [Haloechinothrix alba]|uniref:Predicted arabinose efflux permease, MFS family n=1 Tax=Haloechinothrix alba TaxID=664784 RepID=A0A238VPW6_9PSEU|nr:MFS transporter [Haloechinothrix alba]SNR36187.1 Predicted arabinose efflux permease, MFS family [Haloechinothrix alba]
MSRTFHSLRHRDYRLYWSGMFVSNIGTWMQRVAQDWLVLVVLGGGAQAVGITTGLQFLPFLLVAPFGGLLADRLPKRTLLLATNSFLGGLALVLGTLVLAGAAQIWHVYVLAFLVGVGNALDNPARQAFVSELVGQADVTNAVALNSASFNGARLIGPAAAGGLIALIGTGWLFVINGLSFAAPITMLLMLRLPSTRASPADGDTTGPLGRLRAGVAYVRSRPDLVMVLTIVFGLGTFGMNFQMTMALMATEVYDRGPEEYGLLGSILAVGTLSGALVAARRRLPRLRLLVGGTVLFGVLAVAAGSMPTYATFALTLAPIGVLVMTVLTVANGYIQTTVDHHIRGRVLSLYITILMGGTPAGAPVIGWLADTLGARWSLLAGGTLTALCTALAVAVFARHATFRVRPRLRPLPHIAVTHTRRATGSGSRDAA